MAYFNYHAKVKKMIMAGDLQNAVIVDEYNKISPALLLFFKNHKPMVIRQQRFKEYEIFLKKYGFDIEIPEKFLWFAFFLNNF